MKYFYKLITVIYFLSFFLNPLLADEKTAVIDLDFLVQNSNIGKKILKDIDDLNKKNIQLLEKKNKELKKLEQEIKNKKNILSENDFNQEVKNFQTKVDNFKNEKNKIVNEFNNFRNSELEKIFKTINPIISNYMKENSYNVLLDTKNIFMVNKSSNLTNEVLILINNNIK